MNTAQLAQTVLRLCRKYGLRLTVKRPQDGEPMIDVGPVSLLKQHPFLPPAIRRCKPELIALLETEGIGTCTGADGKVWTQQLFRCPTCGAVDWLHGEGISDTTGEVILTCACGTCASDATTLEQALEDDAQPPLP